MMDGLNELPSGLLVPDSALDISTKDSAEEAAERSLANHFSGMAKLEKTFPQLVKLAIDVAHRVTAYAKRKGLGPEAVLFDTPRWHQQGAIYVRIGLDHEAKRLTTRDRAAKNYTNLRALNDHVPQAVDLVMAIAFSLVSVINVRKLRPEQIQVSKPRFAQDDSHFVFDIRVNDRAFARPDQMEIV